MTMWADDYEHDMADPQDGKEPFKTWWEDMRPVEVRALVKSAYERGYDAAIRERDEALAKLARAVAAQIRGDNAPWVECALMGQYMRNARRIADQVEEMWEKNRETKA